MFVGGDTHEVDRRGEPIVDDSFLVLLNAAPEPVVFTLPPASWGQAWEHVPFGDEESSAAGGIAASTPERKRGDAVELAERTTLVLRRTR